MVNFKPSKMALEILKETSDQRFQQNVSREFQDLRNSGTTSGCISGEKVLISELTWRVSHNLGREAVGFIIIAQGSTTSILCEMSNMTKNDSQIKFSGDPTSFTLFFY